MPCSRSCATSALSMTPGRQCKIQRAGPRLCPAARVNRSIDARTNSVGCRTPHRCCRLGRRRRYRDRGWRSNKLSACGRSATKGAAAPGVERIGRRRRGNQCGRQCQHAPQLIAAAIPPSSAASAISRMISGRPARRGHNALPGSRLFFRALASRQHLGQFGEVRHLDRTMGVQIATRAARVARHPTGVWVGTARLVCSPRPTFKHDSPALPARRGRG